MQMRLFGELFWGYCLTVMIRTSSCFRGLREELRDSISGRIFRMCTTQIWSSGSTELNLTHKTQWLHWHTFPNNDNQALDPLFCSSVSGCISLSYNHQCKHTVPVTSEHHGRCSPQNHVRHLKTTSSSGSSRGQPMRDLVEKPSPDPPGRTRQHHSVSS